MLKTITSKSLFSGLFEKLIHPALIKKSLLSLPFDQLQKGSLTITIVDESFRFEGVHSGRHAELIIVNPFRAYWLLATQGELGFAQAYYEGAIDSSSLYQLMLLAYDNQVLFDSLLSNKTLNLVQLWQHRRRHNSVGNSRKNISFHYDLGNDFYQAWLDNTMTYSSALFTSETESHEQAQSNKYQRILDELQLKPGESILEIGCGWGGFMEAAVKQGGFVKGLTLSEQQQKFAFRRLSHFASNQSFEVALQDYRHEDQSYDHIVSIEMFEAVGKEYWPSYFETLKKSLKESGKAVIQVITIDEQHAQAYQAGVDFIQTYIFPGGLLPSVTQFTEMANQAGLVIENQFEFGQDYARTCQLWKQEFNRHSVKLEDMGFDQAFQRLWNYYLDYCTVGFETGHTSVYQFTLTHRPN